MPSKRAVTSVSGHRVDHAGVAAGGDDDARFVSDQKPSIVLVRIAPPPLPFASMVISAGESPSRNIAGLRDC
jgi:hypothetical protein